MAPGGEYHITGSRALPPFVGVDLSVPGEDELPAFVASWSPPHVELVVARRRASSDLRVFALGGMVYFLFFDEEGRLSSYVLVSG